MQGITRFYKGSYKILRNLKMVRIARFYKGFCDSDNYFFGIFNEIVVFIRVSEGFCKNHPDLRLL